MISYYKFGKGTLTACEDSLTASVIDPLKYLPADLFWHIIKTSVVKDNLPLLSGPIQEISFWDKWSAIGTSNSNFVEPDVFIRFQEFDLIIEAKRYDENQQYYNQLENEVVAYYNEFEEDGKDLYLIQLGGVNKEDKIDQITVQMNAVSRSVKMSKLTWSGILNTVSSLHRKIKKNLIPGQEPVLFILDDVIQSLEIHGFFKKLWIADLKIQQIDITCLETNQLKFNRNGRNIYRS